MHVKKAMMVLAITFFSTSLFAQENKVPVYFPQGIERLVTPAKQYEAYKRYWRAAQGCLYGHWGEGDFSRAKHVSKTYGNRQVVYVFDHIIEVGDKAYYYDFCGQREIAPAERDLVVQDFIQYIERAVDLGYSYYKELEPFAVKRRAENSGIDEGDLRKQLEQPIPEDPKVTYRDLTQIPQKITPLTYFPKEIHLGENVALGVAWLNSGTAWVGLEARILDWISGLPLVGLHELTHTNVVLQSFPMSERVNVELIASVPMAFFDDEFLELPYHSYLRRVREWVWVYFGYDYRQVKKKVITFDFAGNLRIDEKAFNEAFEMQKQFKPELYAAFKELLAEYYSDQPYWGAVNDKLFDTEGVFDVGMSLRYDPTLLGGHAPTKVWLETHKPEIMRMALQAWRESGMPLGNSEMSDHRLTSEDIKLIERLTGMSREELVKLGEKYHISAKDLDGKSVPELMNLFSQIMEREKQQKKGGVQ